MNGFSLPFLIDNMKSQWNLLNIFSSTIIVDFSRGKEENNISLPFPGRVWRSSGQSSGAQMPPIVISPSFLLFPKPITAVERVSSWPSRCKREMRKESTGRTVDESSFSRNWWAQVPLGNGAHVIQEFSMNSL